MENVFIKIRSNWSLTAIYASNLILAFHFFLIIYINSSFLEQSFSASKLGALYIIGSVINLILLLNASKLLRRFGNYRLILSFIILEVIAIGGLAWAGFLGISNLTLIAVLFILHQAVVMMILFNLDVFLEAASTDETKTGGIRGVYLTLANAALVISPAIAGFIILDDEFWRVYLVSALLLIPLFFIALKSFKGFKDIESQHTKILETTARFWTDKNIYSIFMAQFLLQFFYVFMIIYIPIHLHENVGLSWSEIGVMFTIMLLPFVLFEIPAGKLADKKMGEKEILAVGFIIMALATMAIPFITIASLAIWTTVLFLTRVGASLAEVTTESYFFKHVNADNADMISFFRITRPLAGMLAPAVATLSLLILKNYNIEYEYLFLILGIIVLFGLKYIFALVDTK